jgi:hypothetical protein
MAEETPRYPLKEQIVLAVLTALGRISIANGFATDGVTVTRPRRTGEGAACTDKLIRVIQDTLPGEQFSDKRFPDYDCTGPGLAWQMTLACDCIVRLAESAAQAMDQALNIFEADVRKALMADVRWGGLALDSELGPTTYPPGDQGLEGVTVWLKVIYRVAETDPYTKVG